MFSTSGRTRFLTDAQVCRILQWQRNRKTLLQVARENGVSPGTIYRVIESGGQYKRALPLTRAELGRVLEWQRNRKSLVQVAQQYGVSASTIREVIRTGGRYKRSPPPAPSMSWAETRGALGADGDARGSDCNSEKG
jgi:IS30 family transposase